ncbi:hypothetical protein TSUD_366270 [Trifolium subterraneum]|uniref:VQ domain-containing protein n=1 Tax=Trifolium subterraneum TaxID=3900 RepID=A0A2Z6P090_TRISU|nr:hypothetical protein TSUD_366270 [Trifolium subterraneum]
MMMKNKRISKRDKKDIKVTYISSPVKVKTNASNFRALVQELTGQDSNVAEITTMPLEEKDCVHHERVMNKGASTHQQWKVDDHLSHQEDTFLKADYSEFLSRQSFVEPLSEHLQYDLLSFDMS